MNFRKGQAFLLALKGYRHFRGHTFKYHHFGPFSREVSDSVQSAVSAGLLEEREEKFPDSSRRYTYHLTDPGRAFIKDNEELPENMRKYVQALSRQHWRALELAATVAYLQHRKGASSREGAFAIAKKLKPETIPFADGAQKILQELNI